MAMLPASAFPNLLLLLLLGGCPSQTASQSQCRARFDLTVVLDSSGSIRDNNPDDESYDNWNLTLTFVSRLSDLLDVTDSPDEGVRVAGVKFSTKAHIEFFFHTDRTQLKADIMDTEYKMGETNTSGALRLMNEEVFGKKDRTYFLGKQGTTDRKAVRDVALVITDGFSNRDENKTVPEATAAKDNDITLFVIGITNVVKIPEIRDMSSPPQEQNVTYWLLPNFQALEPVVQNIATKICQLIDTTGNTDAPPNTPIAPTAAEITDQQLVIGVGVVAALLFVLLILLLLLCCFCKTTPCCGAFCAGGGISHCCPGCCASEVFCCCGSIFCCYCCAQWLLCCFCCCCWAHRHDGKVSPNSSEVVIIAPEPGFKNKGTNTSLISVKVPALPPPEPKPEPKPDPKVKVVEVCGKCRRDPDKCVCPRNPPPVVPQQPVVRPMYVPQPQPLPALPCPVCYNAQYYNGTACPHCNHHYCLNDTYCEICERNRHFGTVDSSQVYLKYKDGSSTRKKTMTSKSLNASRTARDHYHSDTSNDLTDRYARALSTTQRSSESEDVRGGNSGLERHRDENCSTRIIMLSDDQRSHHSGRATGRVGTPGSETASKRSYSYLPTKCPVEMSSEMAESLRREYMRATAGK